MVAFAKAALLALLASAEAGKHGKHGKRDCVRKKPERCIIDKSDGPTDADIEIKLTGLPASTSTEAVWLNFWAARKSPRPYNPLESLVNCSVYKNSHHAYPGYDDADFNGGNVQVTSSGEATIRVRTPAAHMVWKWVALPHIHMRICNQSGSNAHTKKFKPKLSFTGNEVWAYPQSDTFNVVSAHAYALKDKTAVPVSSQDKEPVTWITWASTDDEEVNVQDTDKVQGESMQIKDGPKKTTTPRPTTTTEKTIRKMRDTDALEFSPVYDCLLGGQFFNHFASECVDGCPASHAVAHGQCVNHPKLPKAANYSSAWDLSLGCGEVCWAEAMNSTLHSLRLIVAGELKIPFQEVDVAVELKASTSRRLDAGFRTFHMTVDVQSTRVSAAEFSEGMQPFPHDSDSLSTMLGIPVGSISHTAPLPTPKEENVMNDAHDPYVPAYDDAERGMRKGSSPLDGLPAEVIVGLAGSIAVIAAAFAAVMLCRRRRQRKMLEQQNQQAQAEKKENSLYDAEKNAAEDNAAAAETNGETKRWI